MQPMHLVQIRAVKVRLQAFNEIISAALPNQKCITHIMQYHKLNSRKWLYLNIKLDLVYEYLCFMNLRALSAKSSESSHKFRQIRTAFDKAGSTTAEENDSKVIGPE